MHALSELSGDSEEIMKNSWIVLFTTGDDDSLRKLEKEISDKFNEFRTNILIVGYGVSDNELIVTELKKICGFAIEGLYVDFNDADNVKTALTEMKFIQIGLPLVIVEKIST